MSRGSGSVDRVPYSQWTNASSSLARRIFLILHSDKQTNLTISCPFHKNLRVAYSTLDFVNIHSSKCGVKTRVSTSLFLECFSKYAHLCLFIVYFSKWKNHFEHYLIHQLLVFFEFCLNIEPSFLIEITFCIISNALIKANSDRI